MMCITGVFDGHTRRLKMVLSFRVGGRICLHYWVYSLREQREAFHPDIAHVHLF